MAHGSVLIKLMPALMENQIENLRKLDINCAMLTSKTDRDEAQKVRNRAAICICHVHS